MKRHLPQTLFACLGVLWLSVWGMTALAQETPPIPATQPSINTTQRTHRDAPNTTLSQYTLSETYTQSQPVNLSLSGIRLVADSGSLIHDVTFSISTITRSEAQPLASNMLSVTAGSHAYRLLPHGEHFSADQPASIELAYEPLAVPHGFKPQDIRTYYFDEQTRRWQPLRRIAIDTARHIVISETTHFTDFINAVIRTPDMPEVNAFVPTTLADMEDPHPLSRVPMIAAPEANTYGTASVTYPIDIPAGRNGLQPDLTLSYSSDRGNGIMGVGWSFPQPAITLDTRWGVPRYDANKETEIYTLNSLQLVQKDGNPDLRLPYQTNTQLSRRRGDVLFIARDPKNADRIIRHGNSPKDYYWTVTDRSGTTYYYGKYASDRNTNPNCVLKDANGNIAHWALAEVVDLYGNYMRYEYHIDTEGNEIYPTYIYYTGHRSTNGSSNTSPAYRIRFRYDFYSKRGDAFSDARLGFVRETAYNLCNIDISYRNSNGEFNAEDRYDMWYSWTTNDTRLHLSSIFMYNIPDVSNRWSCSGKYEIDNCLTDCEVVEERSVSFSYENINMRDIFSKEEVLIEDARPGLSILNAASSQGWGIGGTLTVGLGKEAWNTNLSAGGNYDYSESSGQTDMMLLDMDGDGLPDKVYCQNGYIHYRKQVLDVASGAATFAPAQNTGIRADHLSHEQSATHSWGLQAGASGKVIKWGATISGGWSRTTTYTDCYFADVNADGLPDYVDNGVVYFNQLRNGNGFIKHNGAKTVIVDSTLCKPFYYDGVVDTEVECYWDTVLIDTYTPDITPYLPASGDDNTGYCIDCEGICRDYLYGGNEYDQLEAQCLACSEAGCDMDLGCPECLELCDPLSLSEWEYENCRYNCSQELGCPYICSKCLEEYLTYGIDSEDYQNCADEKCIFPHTMHCEECREECTYHPASCESCVIAMCETDPCIVNDMEVCEDCCEDCQDGDFEKCNQCKVERSCRGVIDYDALYDCNPDNYQGDICMCIDALNNENAICKECLDVCALNPEHCLRCMSRHCYYRNPEDIEDSLRSEMEYEWKQKYPKAIIKTVGGTLYMYMTNRVCPQDVSSEPDIETVRVWVAPYGGVINLTSTVRLVEDTSALRRQSRTADGVRCVIQHNSGISHYAKDGIKKLSSSNTNIIGARDIPSNDYLSHKDQYDKISVKKGDILFFHLMSRGNHNFDNVDWTQHIKYINTNKSYHSASDFVCTDNQAFQSGLSGRLAIKVFVNSSSSHTGTLKMFYKGGNVNTGTLNSSTKWMEFPARNYNAGESIYFTLTSAGGDYGNWDVRIRLTLTNAQDTIVSYIAPRISFTREVTLDSVYYDLFGSLYRGWGQFALNNKTASDLIPIDSLYNAAKAGAQTINNDTTAFKQSFSQFQDVDTTAMLQDGGLQSAFRSAGFYNPLDHYWVEMTADARSWQWEAYGQVGRIGRRAQSNTRTTQLTSVNGETITTSTATTYDNPVPVSSGSITAIRKTGSSKQSFFSMGASIGSASDDSEAGIGGGLSRAHNTYWVTADFMDMNGDRYPDVVRQSTIQYTNPWGGLGKSINVDAHLHETYTSSRGKSLSGTYAETQKIPSNSPKRDSYTVSQSGASSYGSSNSESYTKFVLMDVNGDGLPDKIEQVGDSVRIYLNIGYGFAEYYTRHHRRILGINYSKSKSGNANFGDAFSWASKAKKLLDKNGNLLNTARGSYQMSLAFGVNVSSSDNYTYAQLIDIDGDGYLDYVTHDGSNMSIIPRIGVDDFNYATEYYPSVTPAYLQSSTTTNAGMNLGVTGGIPIWFVKICIGVQTTPVSFSATTQTHDLIDMNGDGLPDLVRADAEGIHVRYNQMGKRGLLRTITNPTGSTIDLSYRLSAPDIEQPHRQWILDAVRITNPVEENAGSPSIASKFVYADPHYDVEERGFYGYGSVTTQHLYTEIADEPTYRTRICRYNNHDFADRGKLIYDALTDEEGNIYTEYELGIHYTDVSGKETDDLCNDTKIRIGKETHFLRYFEGGQDSIVTAKQYDYDRYHNVIAYRNLGDVNMADDDLAATITYRDATSGTNLTNNLVSLPAQVSVSSGSQQLWQTTATYNTEGRLVEYTQSADDMTRTTNYSYNNYGLVSDILLPENYQQQRASYAIEYDHYTQSLPATVTNHWGHTSSTKYHHYWQLPIMVTDVAGQTMQYDYDEIGRLISIAAPNESEQGEYTIQYEYQPRNYRWDHSSPDYRARLSYVDVHTYSDDDNTFHRTFCDARGDIVQRFDRRGSRYVVSNRTARDCFGRSTASYANVWTNRLPQVYYSDNLNLIAQTDYDIMDRPVVTSWADGNTSDIWYGIGSDAFGNNRFVTDRHDENGLSWVQCTSPQGWLTTSAAPDGATTTFEYDALGQLLQSTDPDGLTTIHIYDGFGRRTERNHPDAGTTMWTYDNADNLIASAAQVQLDNGEETTYEYDYNHLTAVHYPRYPQYDITYEYDSETGRLSYVSDITGYEYLAYDAMGNVSMSDKTIVVPTENQAYRFSTQYTYDSFGRIRTLTYPDGEEVTYNYYNGLLYSVGNEAGDMYIQDIVYDKYDSPIETAYGNNFVATSEYDDVRHWAVRRELQDANNTFLQQTDYEYDGVGNITRVAQSAPVYGNNLGGEYVADYTYDDQYRLLDARQYNSVLGDYSYSMSYSPSGLVGTKLNPEWSADMTFGYRYEEEVPFSHQPKMIYSPSYYGDMTLLGWDGNGQMTSMLQPYQNRFRRHWWDETGQLAAAIGNEYCGYYGYNANSEHVYKLTGTVLADQYNAGDVNIETYFDDMVLYVNPYMVVTPQGYTKHYYNGSERIAARLGDYWYDVGAMVDEQDRMNLAREVLDDRMNSTEVEEEYLDDEIYRSVDGEEFYVEPYVLRTNYMNCIYDEDMLYDVFNGGRRQSDDMNGIAEGIFYYHSDHLGSASWITDDQGQAVQYIHYMPYGELWTSEQAFNYEERFKFTGKERDTETGYDYFGARYYLSLLGIWLSPDPWLDTYPEISSYAYCKWNPLKYTDPSGKYFVFAQGTTSQQKNDFYKAIRYLDANNCGGRYGQLSRSNERYLIVINNDQKTYYNPNKKTIDWDPTMGILTDNGSILSPSTALNHEMTHATRQEDAIKRYYETYKTDPERARQEYQEYLSSLQNDPNNAYDSAEEESVIKGVEQRTALKLGEIKEGEVTRQNHKGQKVRVKDPTSTIPVEPRIE